MQKKLIRNFSIIAHIDHGKTTLTDRILLRTNTITEREFTNQMMDSNPIEQERGITIKMAPVQMTYELSEEMKKEYGVEEATFNLIDTPGHVDFSYEVSRSLAAVEGALLLVDATQGIQAQTLSHYDKAKEQNLKIIPVLNKVDLANSDTELVMLEMMELFGFKEEEFIKTSAKTGFGVDDLLEAVIREIPPPQGDPNAPLQALVFSSQFNTHKGVVTRVRVVNGSIKPGQELKFIGTDENFIANEVGIYAPTEENKDILEAGHVGFIASGLKDISLAQVGDTVTDKISKAEPLEGYQKPQLMVYMDFYPIDGKDYTLLLDGMSKLSLHDAALSSSPTHSMALGNGLRVGFLGILHAEIVQERLEREFGLSLIITSPSVKYIIEMSDETEKEITTPGDLPDPSAIKSISEPICKCKIFAPKDYLGAIMQLSEEHRGKLIDISYIGNRAQIIYEIPLAEIIVSYFDELKSVSSGFASLEYELIGYQKEKIVKLGILINGEIVEALSQMVYQGNAQTVGKKVVSKLKDVIPRQNFMIPIQAAIGGKIIARETVRAFRKDVTAKLYGGDISRRKKLLEKQKKGKLKRKQFGKVEIPQEAFFAVLKR